MAERSREGKVSKGELFHCLVGVTVRLIGPLVSLLLLVLTWLLGVFHEEQVSSDEKALAQRQLDIYSIRLDALLGKRLQLLGGLVAFVRYNQQVSPEAFERFAQQLLVGHEDMRFAIAPNMTILHSYPIDGRANRIGEYLLENERLGPHLQRTIRDGTLFLDKPQPTRAGTIISGYQPIWSGEEGNAQFWGMAIASLALRPLFREAGIDTEQRYLISLRDISGHSIYGDASLFDRDALISEFSPGDGEPWQLAILPRGGWSASTSQTVILGLGIPLSLLAGLLVFAIQRQSRLLVERDQERVEIFMTLEAVEERNRLLEEKDRAMRALKSQDEWQRNLFKSLPVGLVLCNRKGKILFANETFCKIVGYSPESVLKLDYDRLTPPDYAVREMHQLETLERLGRIGPYEKEMIHSNGQRVPVRLHGMTIEQDGECLIWSTVEDITGQRISERMLHDSLQASADIMEASPSGIFIFRFEEPDQLLLLDGNAEAERLMGIKIEDCRNLGADEIWPTAKERGVIERWLEVARSGKTLKMEDLEFEGERIENAFRVHVFHMPGNRLGVAFEDIAERKRAEEALRRSEHKLREILANTTSLVYLKDIQGRYLMVNKAMERLLRLSESEILGKTDRDLFGEKAGQVIAANDQLVIESGESHELEETSPLGEGNTYLTVKFPLHHADGSIYSLCGISTDITERIRNEKALRESEDRYRTLIQNAPEAIVLFQMNHGRFVDVNHNAEKLFLLTREELLSKSPVDLSPILQPNGQSSIEMVKEKLRQAMDGETPVFEWVHLNAEGREIFCEVRLVLLPGNLNLIRGSITDISVRKRAHQELETLRKLLSNIVGSMPSMLVGLSADGRVTLWNQEASRITGLSARRVKGRTLVNVFPLFEREMSKVDRAIRHQRPQREQKVSWKTENGELFVDITVYPLATTGGSGTVIRVDDVTDRVRMEEMMIQTEKMMSVGGLAAGMAHEINNPLAGILQNMQVVRNRLSDHLVKNLDAAEACGIDLTLLDQYLHQRGIHAMIDSIMESGKRAAAIVENMLNFSRKGDFHYNPQNIPALLDKTLELASNDYDLKKRYDFRRIQIVKRYQENLPLVPCEAGKIQQVFFNLLKNGAQSMAGYVEQNRTYQPCFTITMKREPGAVCIAIADNGPGMSEAVRRRVFEPFFTTKEVGTGTGLGLSVSYFIVTENHGGTMSVTSSPGKGAVFTIRLPIERSAS